MVKRVDHVVCEHENERAAGLAVGPVHGELLVTAELGLPAETRAPDEAHEEDGEAPTDDGTSATRARDTVENIADNDRSDDGAQVGEEGRKGTSAGVEHHRHNGALRKVSHSHVTVAANGRRTW